MITVVKNNGDVLFFNEKEHISFAFSKDEKIFCAYPTQPDANVGMIRKTIKVEDVRCVTYTNESQPTALTFKTDKTDDGIVEIPEWYVDSIYYPIFDKPVEECGFSVRALSILAGKFDKGRSKPITTIRELCSTFKSDLLKRFKAGKKTVTEIEDFLEDHKLAFGTDVEMIERYHKEYLKRINHDRRTE
jgi:hypothetical protein